MAHVISREVMFDAHPESGRQRRAAAPLPTPNTNNHNNPHTAPGTCCCGDHVHSCGCGCLTCSCRNIPVQDESNREVYSGQGGPCIPSPANGLPDQVSRFPSSVATNDSRHMNMESFNNSFEVHDRLNDRLTAANLNRHNAININTTRRIRNRYAASDSDEDDRDPASLFLSPIDTPHDTPPPADSSRMILAENMDDSSMFLETGGPSSGDMSMLSSQYAASFSRQSVSASQLLNGTGAVFSNQFLRLTPDCRHARPRQY